MAFLNKTGLEHLWAHILNKLYDKSDKGHTHVTTETGIYSGTAALTSGESALPTDTIYVQYE